MSDRERLVFAILQFLNSEVQSGRFSADAAESIEVAQQCLESAYGVTIHDAELANQLRVSKDLQEIFSSATKDDRPAAPTAEQKEKAEEFKNEGNTLMRGEQYEKAIEMYTKAIALDGSNAVYYCNRAAAHSKLNKHEDAIQDCERAVVIDSSYSKAYGRMGLAYTSLNMHNDAKRCYEKALELDPDNQSYHNNLRIAEEKMREANISQAGGAGPGFPNFGGMDFANLLNNPALMNMATHMMQTPQMQQMMASMMSGASGSSQGAGGVEHLLQAGQQLASQMQAENPELVEQLRQQMQGSQNPPPPPDKDAPPGDKN